MEYSIEIRNIEAEMCAIGSMLLSERACDEVINLLKPENFYQPSHVDIFTALRDIRSKGDEPDLVVLKNMLEERKLLQRVGGIDYLVQIAESVPSPSNARSYAGIVRDNWIRRAVIDRCNDLCGKASDKIEIKELFRSLNELPQGLAPETTTTFHLSSVIEEIIADDMDPSHRDGLSTPWPTLNRSSKVSGWPVGEPSVIMAPTGRGKSAAMTQSILHDLEAGRQVLCITYEMSAKAIVRRLLQQLSGWSKPPSVNPSNAADYYEALETLRGYCDPYGGSLTFFDPTSSDSLINTVEDVVMWCRQQAEANKIDCIYIDYIQLLGTTRRTESSVAELVYVTRCLMNLCKRLKCAMPVLSQQNAEGDTSGSKELMKASALTIQIANEQDKFHIKKQRHGKMNWDLPVIWDEHRLTYAENI